MGESEAIARLRRGDISGLSWLVERYETRAVRAAYLVVRDRALAEDVVQAAFVHVFDRIDQYDPARPFGPWFLQSVVNRATRAATREGRSVSWEQSAALFEAGLAGEAGLEEQLEALETGEAIWRALAQLTPEQRGVIVLRYYLDLSEAEMAERLDCPPGTIKSRLHSARRRLRKLLPEWLRPAEAGQAPIHVAPAPPRQPGKGRDRA